MRRAAIIGWITLLGWSSLLNGQINQKRTLSETRHQIYYATYSPDGKFIATTGSDNNIILWNSKRNTIFRTLPGLKKRQNRVVFTSDSKGLFSAGEDGLIYTWDLLQVQIANSTTGHSGAINALDINPYGTLLASGGDDKIVRVWEIIGNNLAPLYELKGHRKTITSLAFSPDGRTLISGGADRLLMKWNVSDGINTGNTEAHNDRISCATYSPDGRFIATGGFDNLIKIWNSETLTSPKILKGHTDWVQTLDYTNSGNHIISGGHDQYIRVWEVKSGEMVGVSNKLEQIVLSVDVCPMRNDIISSCLLSEQLRIWAHGYGPNGNSSTTEPGFQEQVTQKQVTQDIDQDLPSKTEPDVPSITLFSPEPLNGSVIHDKASILIIGKADDPEGIQTMLINRQRTPLSESGIFQMEIELVTGENTIELVAVSNRGKMTRSSFVIHCTDDNSTRATGEQQSAVQGRYHALIIGINDYVDEKIPDLDYPLADADTLYKILINKYSFSEDHIIFLRNPVRTDIIIAMDSLSRTVTTNDNLLVFYAGHGNWDEKSGIGYWLPNDAARSNTANWFRNSTLRDFIGSIQSRHTLLIADACFSGSIFKTRSAFGSEVQGIQKLHELPSRKAMTSGNLKEVPDRSVFVKYLIQELNQNDAKFLPSEELFNSFKTAVLNNSPNVPRYGTIQNVGDEGGDFIFVKK